MLKSVICTVVLSQLCAAKKGHTHQDIYQEQWYEQSSPAGEFHYYDDVTSQEKVYGSSWPYETNEIVVPQASTKDEIYNSEQLYSEKSGHLSDRRSESRVKRPKSSYMSKFRDLMISFGLVRDPASANQQSFASRLFQNNDMKKQIANAFETGRIVFFGLFSIFQGARDFFKVLYYFGIYLDDPDNFDLLATIGEFNILYVP